MKTILIADDNDSNLKLMRFILRNAGYETIEAEDGRKCISAAADYLPRLILMDIQMPVMDGLTAFKSLREDPRTREIPVIAVTAYAMQGDRERLIAEGFAEYISKPISPSKILEMVNRFMGQ